MDDVENWPCKKLEFNTNLHAIHPHLLPLTDCHGDWRAVRCCVFVSAFQPSLEFTNALGRCTTLKESLKCLLRALTAATLRRRAQLRSVGDQELAHWTLAAGAQASPIANGPEYMSSFCSLPRCAFETCADSFAQRCVRLVAAVMDIQCTGKIAALCIMPRSTRPRRCGVVHPRCNRNVVV